MKTATIVNEIMDYILDENIEFSDILSQVYRISLYRVPQKEDDEPLCNYTQEECIQMYSMLQERLSLEAKNEEHSFLVSLKIAYALIDIEIDETQISHKVRFMLEAMRRMLDIVSVYDDGRRIFELAKMLDKN